MRDTPEINAAGKYFQPDIHITRNVGSQQFWKISKTGHEENMSSTFSLTAIKGSKIFEKKNYKFYNY